MQSILLYSFLREMKNLKIQKAMAHAVRAPWPFGFSAKQPQNSPISRQRQSPF